MDKNPTNTITIRVATIDDASIISLLARITFTETFGHLFRDQEDLSHYFRTTFAVGKIERSIEKETTVFWLAYVNELPVGYAKLKLDSPSEFIDSEKVCQLQKIYILKDFLSLKIGLKLQTELLTKAKELAYDVIWLSVLHSNERAITFYKKNGFSFIGNHDFTIGKEYFEFIAMSKNLSV
jgi:ribosomal protein S18 acetylase RimI-like enzyme